MAAAHCYERIPLRFFGLTFDMQMRYLVYMRYLRCDSYESVTGKHDGYINL